MSAHPNIPARLSLDAARGPLYIEVVYVGSAGHLRRYKVVDANGVYVPGGLFRTEAEAIAFVDAQS